ncbi:hydroxycarboxylic acid receptor 2-like [Anguilla rostrata]|uniref:hydroxycarboxylic acid receptor 2-like n=1 Tax=Anguilla rostrata TaxID=7938 RepID=UPI0030CD6B8E
MANSSLHCPSVHNLTVEVLPPVLILEFILGLPGNLVALWIFSCRMQRCTSNTMYLLNLLIADFLLLVSLPFRIDSLMRGENWVFGDAWCRINLVMLAVNRSASIGFMTIVAVDRYFKVVHPHHRVNRITTVQAGILCGMTWAVVLALRLPLLAEPLLQLSRDNVSMCRSFNSYSDPPPIIRLHNAVYVVEFFLPFLLLIFCSVRIIYILRHRQLDKKQQVKRAIQVVLLIVAVFTICFLPGIATGITALFIKKFRPEDCASYQMASQLFSLSIGFTYLNSTLDPIIYCLSSSTFRNTLKRSFNAMGVFHMQLSRRGSEVSDQ